MQSSRFDLGAACSLSDGISSSVQARRDGSLEVVLLLVLRGRLGFSLLLGLVVLFLLVFRSDAADYRPPFGSCRGIATSGARNYAASCCSFCYVVVIAIFLTLRFGSRTDRVRVIAGLSLRAVVALLFIGELLCRTLLLLRVDIESYGARHSLHRRLSATLLCNGEAMSSDHHQR